MASREGSFVSEILHRETVAVFQTDRIISIAGSILVKGGCEWGACHGKGCAQEKSGAYGMRPMRSKRGGTGILLQAVRRGGTKGTLSEPVSSKKQKCGRNLLF